MDIWTSVADVVILLFVALFLGVVSERLKQNALIGYLLAGLLLGPSGTGWVQSVKDVRTLAELGVALLLFTIGTEFSLKRLKELGRIATVGGTLQVLLTGASVALISAGLGLPISESVAIGAVISVSSTTVVLRVLLDRAELDSAHGRNAIGILLLQDLVIVPLVLLISVLGKGSESWASLGRMGLRLSAGAVVIGAIYLAGRRFYPHLLKFASTQSNRELPIILSVAICLGTTYASHAVGLSPMLGAFAGGMLIAESPFAEQVRADISALRAVFVTLFFTSAGMLAAMPSGAGLLNLALLVMAVLVIKAFLGGVVVRLFHPSNRVAVATGLVLAQIGEFSFVLLQAGFQEGVISDGTFRMVQAASVATLLATPYLVAAASRVAQTMVRISAWGQPKEAGIAAAGDRKDKEGRVIVVGYGPAGRHVVRQIQGAGLPVLVLDMNPRAVRAHLPSVPIEFGDATRSEILRHVRLGDARALIVTVPDPKTADLVVRQAKLVAPHVVIYARARYRIFARQLMQAGADHIVDEEGLVGDRLGAEFFRSC